MLLTGNFVDDIITYTFWVFFGTLLLLPIYAIVLAAAPLLACSVSVGWHRGQEMYQAERRVQDEKRVQEERKTE